MKANLEQSPNDLSVEAPVRTAPEQRGMGPLVDEGAVLERLNGRHGAAARLSDATNVPQPAESYPVIVIGAGQAGLSVGYHLARLGVRFLILEANGRVGDTWRKRWDSLRLFTPAQYDGLDGKRFPTPGHYFPTKDEMADYLEDYARHFKLPVRTGVRVDRLTREGERYVLMAGGQRFEAEHVVVAMATYQKPKLPAFARDLSPDILQLHSLQYLRPSQLPEGDVLVVGAGNSGAEIAIELARHGHKVTMSGRDNGAVPFRLENRWVHRFVAPVVLRGIFHRVLTTSTPIGRKARSKMLGKGQPLIRVKYPDLAQAGVERAPRLEGARDGKPVLADGRVLDVKSVVWCTGFEPGFSWIDLPLAQDHGAPVHDRGVVAGEPGLYLTGLHFLYALSSTMIHGAGRDARHIAERIGARVTKKA